MMLRVLIILIVLFQPIVAFSQDNALQLTFKEAVKIALDSNINLRQQVNNLESIQARRTASYGSLFPDLSAFGQGWVSDGNTFIEQEAQVINTKSDNLWGSVDADLTLFGGLRKMNSVKRENHRLNSQTANIFRSEQDVISDLSRQFLIVLQDQEQVRIEEENVRNQEVLLDQINTMFETGSRPIMDKYNQEFEVENARLTLIRARNQLINDKAALAQIMMVDPSINFELIEPDWPLDQILNYNPSLEELYDQAMANRRDLQQFRETAIVNEKNLAVQKALYMPSLSAFYQLSSRYSDFSSRTLDEQFLIDNKRQQYGLRLSIPIYNGLRNRATVVDARIQKENAKLDVENQKVAIKTEVLQAFRSFQAVLSSYEVSKLQMQAAEKAKEVQDESYRLGISNQIDVTRTLRDYVDAQTSLSRSKYALLFQRILLEYSIGTLSFEQLPD